MLSLPVIKNNFVLLSGQDRTHAQVVQIAKLRLGSLGSDSVPSRKFPPAAWRVCSEGLEWACHGMGGGGPLGTLAIV